MEIEIEVRCGGQCPEVYGMRPICFRMEEQFEQSLIELVNRPDFDEMNNRDQFDEIIEQPRTCESFTKWKQGWAPKEHRDMEWRETQDKLVERHHRQSLAIALVGAALGMFATIWATAHNQTPVVNVILSEQAKAVDAGNKPQP